MSNILYEANPNNEEHIQELKQLEKENKIPNLLSELATLNKGEVKKVLFTKKDNTINNIIYIDGYNDIHECNIYLYNTATHKLELIDLGVEYATEVLDMKEVYFHIPNNKNMINTLTKKGYEYIGNLDKTDEIIFMKDVEEDKVKKTNMRR